MHSKNASQSLTEFKVAHSYSTEIKLLFFPLLEATLQPDPMLIILIISEAQGTLTAFQQHYCLWPYNRKANYTSALETSKEPSGSMKCVIPHTWV